MKIILASIIFFHVITPVAFGAPTLMFCHDQYGSQNSTVLLTAQVLDERNLAQVRISSGKLLGGVNLAISNMQLQSANEQGVSLLLSAIPASHFSASVPSGYNYNSNFTVIFKLGSQWFESQDGTSIRGELKFYPDEAGGGLPTFEPNLYCEVK